MEGIEIVDDLKEKLETEKTHHDWLMKIATRDELWRDKVLECKFKMELLEDLIEEYYPNV